MPPIRTKAPDINRMIRSARCVNCAAAGMDLLFAQNGSPTWVAIHNPAATA